MGFDGCLICYCTERHESMMHKLAGRFFSQSEAIRIDISTRLIEQT